MPVAIQSFSSIFTFLYHHQSQYLFLCKRGGKLWILPFPTPPSALRCRKPAAVLLMLLDWLHRKQRGGGRRSTNAMTRSRMNVCLWHPTMPINTCHRLVNLSCRSTVILSASLQAGDIESIPSLCVPFCRTACKLVIRGWSEPKVRAMYVCVMNDPTVKL